MTLRNIVLLTGLAAFQAGCVVVTQPSQPRANENRGTEVSKPLIVARPAPPRSNENRVDNSYQNYKSAPSYQGYDYAQVIFINNVPYYVHDDRRVRPIPPQLHDHFRRYPYGAIGRPLVFSHDTEVRDGYALSRIVYLNDAPYHVTDDRIGRPLPGHLHQRFRYLPSGQAVVPANGNRPQPPVARGDDPRIMPPPAYGREHARMEQPPFKGEQRDKESSNAPSKPDDKMTPFFGRNDSGRIQPVRPELANPQQGQQKSDAQPGASVPPKPDDKMMPPFGRNDSGRIQPVRPEQANPQQGQKKPDEPSASVPPKPDDKMMPPFGRNDSRRMPPVRPEQANLQQGQKKPDEPRASVPPQDGRKRNDVRPQTNGNEKNKDADKKKTSEDKDKDKGNGADEDKKGSDEKKSHEGKDNNQDSGHADKKTKHD